MKNVLRNVTAARFNERFPVGSLFHYYPMMGIPDYEEVITRSEAWELGHGAAVVSVIGRAGGLSVDHLEPIKAATCSQCGCDDHHACVSEQGQPCHWVQVNRVTGVGICSHCAEHLNQINTFGEPK
ncbi:hypothetical protein [Limnobaculum xujianqingii]|uniref:hypothetical protein n=1 Tax=Limnobaculum xujianqingii TaxID=2738837 RepID=UPI0015B8629D|nr:hypothetical protein [Limnobaculum xujianqingii]